MGFSLILGFAPFPTGNAHKSQPVAVVAPAIPGHIVTMTAYNAVAEQTDGNPFETASGAYSNPEIIAARSRDLADELPFGTIIEIDGSTISPGNTCGYGVVAHHIGYRVIEDTMNARYTDRVDVLLNTEEESVSSDGRSINAANVFGICKGVTVRVVGFVDIRHLPKTQAGLAALVKKGTVLAVK
ncbi:MAG: hypothetical protein WCW36_03110 [Candidatus Paceibacterota bacterium]